MENLLFYTYPVTALLCLCPLFFYRYVSAHKTRDAFVLFSLMSIIVLTRSLYQIWWMLFFLVLLLLILKDFRKRTLLAAALPLVLVLAFMTKNAVCFGQFGTSSWLGMSISRNTTFALPLEERKALVEEGLLSRFALIEPYQPLTAYAGITPKTTGIPALDVDKSPSGRNNYNNTAYLEISNLYFKDALRVLGRNPATWLKKIGENFEIYLRPVSDRSFSPNNARVIWDVQDFRKRPASWINRFVPDLQYNKTQRCSVGRVALKAWLIILLVCSPLLTIESIRKRSGDPAHAMLILFLTACVFYNVLMSISFDSGENMRFRFSVDPFFVALSGLLLFRIANAVKSR